MEHIVVLQCAYALDDVSHVVEMWGWLGGRNVGKSVDGNFAIGILCVVFLLR